MGKGGLDRDTAKMREHPKAPTTAACSKGQVQHQPNTLGTVTACGILQWVICSQALRGEKGVMGGGKREKRPRA